MDLCRKPVLLHTKPVSQYGLLPPQISTLIQDLQELHAHTPQEHVDYDTFQEIRDELNCIQKVQQHSLYLLHLFLRISNITVPHGVHGVNGVHVVHRP